MSERPLVHYYIVDVVETADYRQKPFPIHSFPPSLSRIHIPAFLTAFPPTLSLLSSLSHRPFPSILFNLSFHVFPFPLVLPWSWRCCSLLTKPSHPSTPPLFRKVHPLLPGSFFYHRPTPPAPIFVSAPAAGRVGSVESGGGGGGLWDGRTVMRARVGRGGVVGGVVVWFGEGSSWAQG